jgi:hypothetical protein
MNYSKYCKLAEGIWMRGNAQGACLEIHHKCKAKPIVKCFAPATHYNQLAIAGLGGIFHPMPFLVQSYLLLVISYGRKFN